MGTGHSEDLNSKSVGCKICALNPSFQGSLSHTPRGGGGEGGSRRVQV